MRLWLVAVLLATLLSQHATAAPLSRFQVPEVLRPWVDWVTYGEGEFRCPVAHRGAQKQCQWPSSLQLSLSATGGRFSQEVTLYQAGYFRLPGSVEHWPQQVQIDEQKLTLVEKDAAPHVWLGVGRHRVQGQFQWRRLPQWLSLNPQTGLLEYQRDGQVVTALRIEDGRLRLQPEVQRAPKAASNRLNLQVNRLLRDGHPIILETELQLEVSGVPREVLLGPVLPEQAIPLALDSALPARLEPDGRLRVQLRAGQHQLWLKARYTTARESFSLPSAEAPWPEQEVWAFQSDAHIRTTEVLSNSPIDPHQTTLPPVWRQWPAYLMHTQTPLELRVIRRGQPEPEPDQWRVQRDLWLDFSGQGYTLRDRIHGQMHSGWRLQSDARVQLGQVRVHGRPQLITRLSPEGQQGVELRQGALDVEAIATLDGPIDQLPASAWGRDLQSLRVSLHAPPGWSLLAVSGADNVPQAWVWKWSLYDVFLVLLISIAVGKLWRWWWALIALLALALSWHEPAAPHGLWLLVLALVVIQRLVQRERWRRMLGVARGLIWLLLLMVLWPFATQQVREALYPQLEFDRAVPTLPVAAEVPTPAPTKQVPYSVSAALEEMSENAAEAAPRQRLQKSVSDYFAPSAPEPLPSLHPDALVQTGPGVPQWRWAPIELRWRGPVLADQTLRLWWLTPNLHRLWNVLMLALLGLLLWRLLDLSWSRARRDGWGKALLAGVLLAGASQAQAQEVPPEWILDQLRDRLLQQPVDGPRAAIERLELDIQDQQLHARLHINALQDTMLPLPMDLEDATPVRVYWIEREEAAELYRHERQLWLWVPKGESQVQLQAHLRAASSISLSLPLVPQRVQAKVRGWQLKGLDDNGVPRRRGQRAQLTLTREQAVQQDTLSASQLPAFFQVERVLRLGVYWRVHTRVRRLSPLGRAAVLHLPLLPGASVLSEDIRVKDGRAELHFGPHQRELEWSSHLEAASELALVAAEAPDYLETWTLDASPIWHVEHQGLVPVHHVQEQRWMPSWAPWPGESLSLSISRPQAVEGQTTTVADSQLSVELGSRAAEYLWRFNSRSSRGGQLPIELAPGAKLLSVEVDGHRYPMQLQGQTLELPLKPTQQHFSVRWQQAHEGFWPWRSAALKLPLDSHNARLEVQLPEDRWMLWLSGPTFGPAVLFWSTLTVLLLAALVLARVGRGRLPLGFVSWLLLGVGLSQVSALGLVLVGAWFFALQARRQNPFAASPWRFNLLQMVLLMLTLLVAGILFWAVQQGLLGRPNMQIAGNGSYGHALYWYQDQVAQDYPQVRIWSLPLWVYRGLMLLWALWLVFALLRWLRWGWQAWGQGGFWRSMSVQDKRPSSPPDEPPPDNVVKVSEDWPRD